MKNKMSSARDEEILRDGFYYCQDVKWSCHTDGKLEAVIQTPSGPARLLFRHDVNGKKWEVCEKSMTADQKHFLVDFIERQSFLSPIPRQVKDDAIDGMIAAVRAAVEAED